MTDFNFILVSQLSSIFHEPKYVKKAFMRSLENLNISYIDMFMIEYPIAYNRLHKDGTDDIPHDVDDVKLDALYQNGSRAYENVDYLDTYNEIETLVRLGMVRSIGLSNFNIEQIDRILANARITPAVNQIEFHPNLIQTELRLYCQRNHIIVVAHSPLGRPHTTSSTSMAFHHPKTREIANSFTASSAQVLLRYAVRFIRCFCFSLLVIINNSV